MQSLKISLLVFIFSITVSAQWYDRSAWLPELHGYAWTIDSYDSLIATVPYTRSDGYTVIRDSLYITTGNLKVRIFKTLMGGKDESLFLFNDYNFCWSKF